MEESIFVNNDEIKKVVYDNYGIDVNNIEYIDRGSSNIYNLDNKYILKEFESKHNKDTVLKEVNIINHLKKKDIPTPTYIKTNDNKYYFEYKNKVIIIQEYIDGYTIEPNNGNYKQVIESATYLGKIVKALEDYPYELQKWHKEIDLEKAIINQKELLSLTNDKDSKIRKDLKDRIKMIEELSKTNIQDNFNNFTYKNTHGDYSVMQFIYKDEKVNAVIDFLSACIMPIVWEVIRSYSYIDKDFNIDTFIDYVKEFSKYVKLNKDDLRYMSYYYLVQILTSTYGYKQYLNNRKELDLLNFGYFRTELCRYLYKNAKEIGDRLMEEYL